MSESGANTSKKSACVKEALRFATAVPSRLPRVIPKDEPEPFIVDGKVVPPGVSSITSYYNRAA